MKFILVINDSPWGSASALAALRIARAALDAGHALEAIFFRGEGVYNAVAGTVSDADTPDLAQAWAAFADRSGTELMVCQASARRRLNALVAPPFREAGLVEFTDRASSCDRVVTF